MTQDNVKNETAIALQALLDEGRLKGNMAQVAGQCLRRLNAPLQVAIVGTDATLATGTLNLLVGKKMAEPSIGHLSLQVEHGEADSAVARYADKSEANFDEDTLGSVFKNKPMGVKMRLNLAPLSKASFYRVTRDDPSNLQGILTKLSETADVVLWCGQSFGRDDKNAFEALEARTREHSHMLTSEACYSSVMDGIAPDEFKHVLPIDPVAAMTALTAEGGADKAAFKAAGGTELIRTIKKEIESTLQAAQDTAEIIVTREGGFVPKAAPSETETPQPEAPKVAKPTKPTEASEKTGSKAEDAPATPRKKREAAVTRPLSAKKNPGEESPTEQPKKVAPKPAKAKAEKPASAAPKAKDEVLAKAQAMAKTRTRVLQKSKMAARTQEKPSTGASDGRPDEIKPSGKKAATPWSLGIDGDGLNELDQCVDLSSEKLAVRDTSFEGSPVDYR